MEGSRTLRTVPPTSLPPCISLIFAGFQILAPAGVLNAFPYCQVELENGPWFVEPDGATCRALLSWPAGAARGYCGCCAPAWFIAMPSSVHVNIVAIELRIAVPPCAYCLLMVRR